MSLYIYIYLEGTKGNAWLCLGDFKAVRDFLRKFKHVVPWSSCHREVS